MKTPVASFPHDRGPGKRRRSSEVLCSQPDAGRKGEPRTSTKLCTGFSSAPHIPSTQTMASFGNRVFADHTGLEVDLHSGRVSSQVTEKDTRSHRTRPCEVGAKIGMTDLKAKGRQGSPAAARSQDTAGNGFSPGSQKEPTCRTFISDF